MHLFLLSLAVVLAAYHLYKRQIPSVQRIVAYLIVVAALTASWAGLRLAITEHALGRYGRVVAGTLRERVSTTGEIGTRTVGVLPAALIPSEANAFYEILERLIATGSAEAWAVTYDYPCGQTQRCEGRAVVSRARWLQMHAGDAVAVRYVQGRVAGARLDDDSQWATAIARMAIGTALFAAAVLFWGGAAPALTAPLAATAWEHDTDRHASYGRILAIEVEDERALE